MSIGIVGLGYVGLPLAVDLAEAGRDVVGLDLSATRVERVAAGDSYVEDITDERLRACLPRIRATTAHADLAACDAIVICVPTPLTDNREPDLAPLLSAAEDVGAVLRAGQLVSVESTTYPGTTREQIAPRLERGSGLTAGTDFHLTFSPERVDPGRTDYTMRTTPKVLGGLTPACLERGMELYGAICDTLVPVSSPDAAELTKLLENIFRSVNIALVNELAMLTDRMGIDIWEVVDAAATKPYGFMRFEPGPGMGGHCLPVDPFYLAWRARQFDTTTQFVELAGRINQEMPYHCLQRIERALNEHGKAVRGSKVALIGVSYKAGVGDMREAPALKIATLLQALGADLRYHDPYVAELPDHGLTGGPLAATLEGADVAVIVTAHPGVDHEQVVGTAPLVLDLRGVTRGRDLPNVRRL